ncbi:OLC1v1007175C2 [Oldenlandia corymbosa var. corymbosa]|uniref:OLC1v1007175C2 n=1 Tax=Oldenlandia corymbosa var. corymbosa TaxID=529605 RepID=A0AAV1DIP2_OLDCO|nr:OLC1v1007175C2 [Oldenlandia corymbosa var. corymbosa]
MMTGYGMVQDQNMERQIEKQMGCMAGFLHIFDRHQILSGKKSYSPKRLPPSKVVDSGQGSEKSGSSTPAVSRELVKPLSAPMTPPPGKMAKSPVPEITPPKSPLPLPVFEMKDGSKSSWKYCKEAPRLSLDSRATVDAKGSLHPREIRTNNNSASTSSSLLTANADDKQRRSPSVIARLMGLEPLQADSNAAAAEESAPKDVQLRRSASESRVSRDLFCYHSVENNGGNNSFQSNMPNNSIGHDGINCSVDHTTDMYSHQLAKNANSEQPKPVVNNRGAIVSSSPWKAQPSRRSYFDAADVFPEPKQQAVSIYGDIEKRLKLRGIDEPSKDLETLKQILEALQLKGLLHSNHRPSEQRNFVYDRSFWSSDESPIVVMRPSSNKSPVNRRVRSESPPSRHGVRRSPNNNLTGEYHHQPSSSPRRERPVIDRGLRSPTRTGTRPGSGNSIIKPKPLTVETQRSMESRRVSPAAHSPKLSLRRNVMTSQDPTATNRSPRRRRSPANNVVITEDESSSISESTISTPSQTDTERSKMEDYREGGKSLLERCDKLLHSIAEMNNAAAAEMQPSPVSVLDSAFFRDESSSTSSPSPVMKRSIDFKGTLHMS